MLTADERQPLIIPLVKYTWQGYGKPKLILERPARDIKDFDGELRRLVADMFHTMYNANGVGLAANQVGIDRRVCVIDISNDRSQRIVMINPAIRDMAGEQLVTEGCLSVPGIFEKVMRANWVRVEYWDIGGLEQHVLEAEGKLAQAVQHEVDHLNGRLFIDCLPSIKRKLIREKIQKLMKRNRW